MAAFVLCPNPVLQFFDNNGNPAVGGSVLTQVGGVNFPTYSDSAGMTPLPNPIPLNSRGEVSTSTGASSQCLLAANTTYTFTLKDAAGNTLWVEPYVNGSPFTLDQSVLGPILYPQTAAELSAGVTPSNYIWPPGDPRRYGAVLDNVTDDTAALNRWSLVTGNLTFPSLTAKVSGPITLYSNTSITASRGATISSTGANISILQATSQSNIAISGLKLIYTNAGSTPSTHFAGVYLLTCTNCMVANGEFAGMQFSGVWLDGSSNCVVRNNYFHDGQGAAFINSHDIAIYTGTNGATAKYNLIDGNQCFGAQCVGILMQDGTLTNAFCQYNQVIGNFVKNHVGYGIVAYMTAAAPDSNNKIVANHVENIIGSFIDVGPSTQNFGAGIYVQGAGGTLVADNTVLNCCQQTNSTSLAPAAIGVSNIGSGQSPVAVVGNIIKGMTQYWGILFTGVSGGGTIVGNTIEQPSTNTTGDLIKIANSLNISVEGNTLNNLNTTTNQMCIAVWAQGASCNLIDISGNTCLGGFQQQIRTIQTGGNTVAGVTIRGNHCSGGQSGCVPLTFDSGAAVNVLVTGNNFRAGASAPAIKLIAGTGIRMADNFVTGGNPILDFSGTSSACFYSQSNTGQGGGVGISNAGTGVIVEVQSTGAISAGTWAVGDMIRNTATTNGGVVFSLCTVAGTGGGSATFKTISNT
jgi:parallel beta-helix repeat protein